MDVIALTIRGEAASKANSREIVTLRIRDQVTGELRARTRVRKSDKALAFERSALRQIPLACRQRLTGPVRVTMCIYYASARPDLDESLLLDVLQDRFAWVREGTRKVRTLVQAGVYRNDRQVWSKRIDKGIDRENPRAEISVEPLTAQQDTLAFVFHDSMEASHESETEGDSHGTRRPSARPRTA